MDLFSARTWENYDPQGLIAQRLNLIKKIIPSDVQSILDAGCGNGFITNTLAADYDIVGLDFSPAALEHVQTKKVLAPVTAMPFADKSFDLCMCNEVLEHLSDSQLADAVSELKRIARKYILVSVPNQELLESSLIKCRNCGKIFHAYGHFQSFNKNRLDQLFQLHPVSVHTLGPKQNRYHKSLLRYRQDVLNQWFSPDTEIPCPKCGLFEVTAYRSWGTKIINAINRVTTIPKRYWLMILYEFSDAEIG